MTAPLISGVSAPGAIVQSLLKRLPGYTPEWTLKPGAKGYALLEVLARFQSLLEIGKAGLRERNLLALLDMLAVPLLPAQAARAPVVFQLNPDCAVDVTLAADSQLAAQPAPPPPSPLAGTPAGDPAPVLFFTEQTIALARAKLASLYSVDPGSDTYADHSASLTDGFTVFGGMERTEHAIYLGHDRLFKLGGHEITLLLQCTLDAAGQNPAPSTEQTVGCDPSRSVLGAVQRKPDSIAGSMGCCETARSTLNAVRRKPASNAEATAGGAPFQSTTDAARQKPLDIQWQYLSEAGWISLQLAEEEDTTRSLTRDGQIALRLNCGPDAKKETFHGRSTYWVRGTLKSPVIRGENLRHNPITINDLRIRVQFKKKDLLPEAAFADGIRLDVTKDFYPFGQQPATLGTFYVASAEVFQRGGARVHIDIRLSTQGGPKGPLKLQWQYYGSGGWRSLPAADGAASYKFDVDVTKSQRISFNCPTDWQESEVSGTKSRWLRVHISEGSYSDTNNVIVGRDAGNNNVIVPMTYNTVAPVVSKLTLSYTYITDPETLDHCLTRNEFIFKDHTEDVRWPDRSFDPFWPVSDHQPVLHFGFDQRLPAGLVSLYVQVPGAEELEPGTASAFTWEYLARSGWLQLGVRDDTHGLRQSGMVQFIGPPDAVASLGLGGNAYRIRARLKDGKERTDLPVSGLWLNSVWASHRMRVEQEMLGMADGTPGQALRFVHSPVLSEEKVEIREWAGSGEGWQLIARQVPEDDLRYEREPVSKKITAAWVRWRDRPHLYDAKSDERVFVLERATGLIRFGNGRHGMIPPAGSRIVVSYLTGGGLAGNVPRATITQLRSAVPFVANATNPIAAAGGADGESLAALSDRGPQHLRHHDRAITASDIEWIARDTSPEVARARCLAITGPAGHAQRGWITVIVVPLTSEDRPWPSAELQRRVADHLRAKAPAGVAKRLQVVEPSYIALNVSAEIVAVDPGEAATVEARLRENLNRFLHPLRGGPDGKGWGFGEGVHLSNIAAVIEGTEGVDYARDIHLYVDGGERCQSVAVPRNALLCAGAHELKLAMGVR